MLYPRPERGVPLCLRIIEFEIKKLKKKPENDFNNIIMQQLQLSDARDKK
jgi:hypothetical protein